jgi:hypothetical protein
MKKGNDAQLFPFFLYDKQSFKTDISPEFCIFAQRTIIKRWKVTKLPESTGTNIEA